jgi:NAD(P)-dependent dehydrogenase (short-subunit alcohol dehydrogenase family)
MTAQSLAEAGHTVYASMRETAGRNAPQVAAIASWAADKKVDLRSVELDVQSDASADAGTDFIIVRTAKLPPSYSSLTSSQTETSRSAASALRLVGFRSKQNGPGGRVGIADRPNWAARPHSFLELV